MDTPAGHHISHADHGVTEAHCRLIDTELADWDGLFTIRVVEIPGNVAPLMSGLYGPAEGDPEITEDQVTYRERGTRAVLSRLVDRAPRPVMSMVIIAGPGQNGPIIYTCYGGNVVAPKEWQDPSLLPLEAIESATFWSVHALSSHT